MYPSFTSTTEKMVDIFIAKFTTEGAYEKNSRFAKVDNMFGLKLQYKHFNLKLSYRLSSGAYTNWL